MRKVNFILFLILLSTGCSVIRNIERSNYGETRGILSSSDIGNVTKQNLTSGSFFIQKAEIEIVSPEGKQKLLGSIKFEYPGKYLISIKSRTGIEAARIFISDDTILVNDRINRKLYYGTSQYLKIKYGISTEVLPVVIGDYIGNEVNDNNKTICSEGILNLVAVATGVKIRYTIDCKSGKAIYAIPENGLNNGEIKLKYDNFLREKNVLTPGRIRIEYLKRRTSIEIIIKKLEFPWIGNIEFIPGNKYEILQLQ